MSSVTPSVVSMPVHHHAEAVAHQHEIDMLVEQPRGVGVVAGEADDRLRVLVRADFRNSDALGLDDGGHGGAPSKWLRL